jgi:hypothetical protein
MALPPSPPPSSFAELGDRIPTAHPHGRLTVMALEPAAVAAAPEREPEHPIVGETIVK